MHHVERPLELDGAGHRDDPLGGRHHAGALRRREPPADDRDRTRDDTETSAEPDRLACPERAAQAFEGEVDAPHRVGIREALRCGVAGVDPDEIARIRLAGERHVDGAHPAQEEARRACAHLHHRAPGRRGIEEPELAEEPRENGDAVVDATAGQEVLRRQSAVLERLTRRCVGARLEIEGGPLDEPARVHQRLGLAREQDSRPCPVARVPDAGEAVELRRAHESERRRRLVRGRHRVAGGLSELAGSVEVAGEDLGLRTAARLEGASELAAPRGERPRSEARDEALSDPIVIRFDGGPGSESGRTQER